MGSGEREQVGNVGRHPGLNMEYILLCDGYWEGMMPWVANVDQRDVLSIWYPYKIIKHGSNRWKVAFRMNIDEADYWFGVSRSLWKNRPGILNASQRQCLKCLMSLREKHHWHCKLESRCGYKGGGRVRFRFKGPWSQSWLCHCVTLDKLETFTSLGFCFLTY